MTSEQVDGRESTDVARRSFVIATVAAAACACCGSVDEAVAQSKPATKPVAGGGSIDVGTLAGFDKDGVNVSFAKSKKLLVIRNEGRLYASSAICTHKACILEVKNGEINCPCHKSTFSNYGTVIKGQAKESLVRFAIAIKDGKVVVNPSKSFREKEWDKPESFIDVSKT